MPPHRCEHMMANGYSYGHYGHPYAHSFSPGISPAPLLSGLSTVLMIALFIVLAWAVLQWLIPYIIPFFEELFDTAPEDISALEILRQRYAAGEIDAVTFEQMRERLEASYRRGEPGQPS